MRGFSWCIVAVLLSLCALAQVAIAEGTSDYRALLGGWEYRWGDTAVWREVAGHVSPRTPPGRVDRELLYLRNRLPSELPDDPVLYITGAKYAVDVKIDGESLYQWWPLSSDGHCAFGGFPSHIVPLTAAMAGAELELVVCSTESSVGLYGDVAVSDSQVLVQRLMKRSMLLYVVAFILCFVGFLGSISYLVNRRREYLWFMGGSLSIGIYVLCRAPARSLLMPEPLVFCYLELASLSIAVVTWFAFLDAVLRQTWRNLGEWIWRTAGAVLLVIFSAHIVGWLDISSLIIFIQFVILTAFAVGAILSVREARLGNAEARLFVLAACAVSGFGSIDVLISMGVMFPSLRGGLYATPFGVLVVVWCFVYLLIMRVADFYRRLRGRNRAFEKLVEVSENIATATSHGTLSERYREGVLMLTGHSVSQPLQFTPHSFAEEDTLTPGLYDSRREEISQEISGPHPLTVHDPELDCPLVLLPVPSKGDRSVIEPLTNTVLSCLTRLRLETTLRRLFERNAEMQSILKSINQVILMLDSSLRILPDYSRMAGEIFSDQKIEGKLFEEVVLSTSTLSQDERMQCLVRLKTFLGDSWYSFRANEPGLPRELDLRCGDRLLRFELSWIPVLDSEKLVERVIMVMRDVTEERHLEMTTRQRSSDLAILTTMNRLSLFELNSFFASARQLCVMWKSSPAHYEAENVLRRDMHTLKGNARTLGFDQLSALVHQVEDRISELCAQESESEKRIPLLEIVVAGIEEELSRYGELGRRRGASGGGDESDWQWARLATQEILEGIRGERFKDDDLSLRLHSCARRILADNTSLSVSKTMASLGISLAGDDALLSPNSAAILLLVTSEWLDGACVHSSRVEAFAEKSVAGICLRLTTAVDTTIESRATVVRWLEWLTTWASRAEVGVVVSFAPSRDLDSLEFFF